MLLKKTKLFSAVICIITVLSVLSLIIPRSVSASDDKSITLVCISDDTVLVGMTWKIYRIGERTNDSRNFIQTGQFAGVQVNLRKLTEDRVNQAAQTFQTFAVANQIPALQEGVTNQNGEVTFSNLGSGLYLITGKLLKVGSHYYVPTTAIVEVKESDTDVRYNAYPKFEYQVMNQQPRAHIVYKEWVGDENHLSERPDHVTVNIYKNEELYETVVLNDANKWRYRWIDEFGDSSWLAMETDVPLHYEMNIEFDENYRIQNSYTDEPFTTTSVVQTGTTSTTASVNNTGVSLSTTTTAQVSNIEASRTRTGTGTTTTQTGDSSGTTTTGDVANITATRTRTTSGTELNGSATATTTSKKSSGSGSGSGGGNSGGSGNGKGSGGKKNTTSSIKLPQTGQLWWPVVPLSIGGVLFVSAGLVIKKKKK